MANRPLHRVHLALGSNIDPVRNLQACLALLRLRCTVIAVSPVYETAPVGYIDQDNFLNAAVLLETPLTPEEFRTQVILPVEIMLRRTRDPNNPDAPRTIDLDIALWDEAVFDFGQKPWHVPDRNIVRYSHVARPLADLSPTLRHPEAGRTLAEIAAGLPADGLHRRDDVVL